MQLTKETKTAEEIKVNMSMQAETPVSKDVMNDIIKEKESSVSKDIMSDIIKERNLIEEKNCPKIDDGTITILEKSHKIEKKIDGLQSATEETLPREIDTNGHEKLKCYQEKDSLNESDLLENKNTKNTNTTSESANSKICYQDENEVASENLNMEMTTNENSVAINTTDSINTLSESNINKICRIQDKKEIESENSEVEIATVKNTLLTQKKECTDAAINTNDNSNTSNKNENVIQERQETTDTENVLNTINAEKSSCISEMSDVNKEVLKTATSLKDFSSSENIVVQGDIIAKNDVKGDDNVVTGSETKPSPVSENLLGKVVGNLTTTNSKQLDDTATAHKLQNSSEVRVDNDINMYDEKKTLGEDNALKIDSKSMDIKNQGDIAPHDTEKLCISDYDNSSLLHSEKTNTTTKNSDKDASNTEKSSINEMSSSVQNEKNSIESKILEDSSLPIIKKTIDISKPELTNTPIHDSKDANKKEKLENVELLENNETTFQENVRSVMNTKKNDCEKGNVLTEKKVESMEIDSNEIDLEKEKSDKTISKTDTPSTDVLSMETEMDKFPDQGLISQNVKNVTELEHSMNKSESSDVELKQIEKVTMETDDVEIVDLEKEKHDGNICKTDTVPNITKDKEPQLLSERITNKETTELTIVNAAEEPKIIEGNKVRQEEQEIIDEDEIKIVEDKDEMISNVQEKEKTPEPIKQLPVVCKLSNTLDILSDDEEESSKENANEADKVPEEKQCINIDDDDDVMLIDEDSNSNDATNKDKTEVLNEKEPIQPNPNEKIDLETDENNTKTTNIAESTPTEKDSSLVGFPNANKEPQPQVSDISDRQTENMETKKPLLPQNFLKTAKKNLADMSRHELEDFCILRIVESIVDRSNLSDIKSKMKTMAQNLEDFRKRAMMLTKQNRDLQVVLKSVQEEQKKRTNTAIQPLKITRSVGMQVLMNDKIDGRRKGPIPNQTSAVPPVKPTRAVQAAKTKPPATPTTIPVPRKVPVNNNPAKTVTTTSTNNTGNKTASPTPNGLRNPSPVQKAPEKRTHSRMQATSSYTVDLTDDEPPPKVNNKNVTVPPVRVVPPQNLLAQQRPFAQPLNSPRKVYIPISGPQGQSIRPGQTVVMRGGLSPGPRQRLPSPRLQQPPIRINKQGPPRHPAPLPDAMKQYTPPTWKSLPPAPDLKLSKVENGIVISWKIDAQETDYETIVSYQLYAYQETTAPPNTALWKKIGDVKALPLPMACTLTQFMAGFKYYFAVRAVDIRSRLGPFSLPGSILLLNKL